MRADEAAGWSLLIYLCISSGALLAHQPSTPQRLCCSHNRVVVPRKKGDCGFLGKTVFLCWFREKSNDTVVFA
jgi:hypothetical protein